MFLCSVISTSTVQFLCYFISSRSWRETVFVLLFTIYVTTLCQQLGVFWTDTFTMTRADLSYTRQVIFKSHCWNYVMLTCAIQLENSIDAQSPNHTCSLNVCLLHDKSVLEPVLGPLSLRVKSLSLSFIELCADELVVGGGVGWSYDRRRRRAAHFIGGGGVALWSAASPASDRMREH